MEEYNRIIDHPTKEGWKLIQMDIVADINVKECSFLENDMQTDDSRIIRVEIPLPNEFWDPVKININVPDDLVKSAVGEVKSVDIPITINDNDGVVKVDSNIGDVIKNKDGSLVCVLTRVLEYLKK